MSHIRNAWGHKYRVLLAFLIVFAMISYYHAHGQLFMAFFNGIGVWGVTMIGALAYKEKCEVCNDRKR